ncbi:uncharacterized protein A4U43_C01F16480 [Asparagus officinalis]|uniref:Golgi SNAP receptor complex member 1 n=1 Tax=Asparagus officinalis TaxID=4686 RepID=A0A5P1FRJ3_ASPOF|nr:uncharacterized protein A4U43_C01F16480 [Asparagus officinalis]
MISVIVIMLEVVLGKKEKKWKVIGAGGAVGEPLSMPVKRVKMLHIQPSKQQEGYIDTGSPSVGPSRSCKSMEMEIESLLEKLLDINDSMSRCAATASATSSVNQKLARHRDILHEYTQEFRRTKGNLNSMREHAELLTSVRDDISESKASGSLSPAVQLLRERASVHGSISHIDEVIGQAQATRSVLGAQRALFGDVQGKVKHLGEKFPIIRGLIGAIRRKRSRDTLILAAVIAACTLFLIIYWLSK